MNERDITDGQPMAPVAPGQRPKSSREAGDNPHGDQKTDETGNIVGGVPRVSAAGMREDSEAGAFSSWADEPWTYKRFGQSL
ncbi:hypothetical protein [Methylomagnum sp.]